MSGQEHAVKALLAEAEYLDPGLLRAALPPIGSPQRERFERVRDHYIAYGIRHALDNLGLLPDAAADRAADPRVRGAE